MSFVIIGVALSAVGLIGVAMASADRWIRIGGSLVVAAGVVMLVVSRPSTTSFQKQSKAVQAMCADTARQLQSFELDRSARIPPWSADQTAMIWDGTRAMLMPAAHLCIRDVESCLNRLMTTPLRPRFFIELHELIVAVRTGEPCTR
jgi:hypothetical protein